LFFSQNDLNRTAINHSTRESQKDALKSDQDLRKEILTSTSKTRKKEKKENMNGATTIPMAVLTTGSHSTPTSASGQQVRLVQLVLNAAQVSVL
jgi:hypothetical protein